MGEAVRLLAYPFEDLELSSRSGIPYCDVLHMSDLRLAWKTRVAVVLALCLPLAALAQTSPARSAVTEQAEESAATQSNDAMQSRQRIVDPAKFPPKTPVVGRIFLAPFRAVAPGLQSGLTAFEESRIRQRIQAWLGREFYEDDLAPDAPRDHRHLHYKLRFATLGDGSGFGPGLEVSTAEVLSKDFGVFLQAHPTMKRYLQAGGGLRVHPGGVDLWRGFMMELAGRYNARPREDFWGVGPQSLFDDRSTYYLQERGAKLEGSYYDGRRLKVGIGLDYSASRVFEGKDARFPTTQAVFSPALPGLDTGGAALFGPFAFVQFDFRDITSSPRAGAFVRMEAASLDNVGRGDYGFMHYRVDSRMYLPIWTRRRIIALRLLGDFNDPKGGSSIPFFRLARLGDSETLRGYESFRFHGRNALMGSIEYRMDLTGGLGAFFFTDIGQVFDRAAELNTRNTHATWGGGIELKSKKSTFLRLYTARAGESSRFFFKLGAGF